MFATLYVACDTYLLFKGAPNGSTLAKYLLERLERLT
jgi:hypothetical protein